MSFSVVSMNSPVKSSIKNDSKLSVSVKTKTLDVKEFITNLKFKHVIINY